MRYYVLHIYSDTSEQAIFSSVVAQALSRFLIKIIKLVN